MKSKENASGILTEDKARKLMHLFDTDVIDDYIKYRKQSIDSILKFKEEKAKNHYLKTIDAIDQSFNDDTELIESIKELLSGVISKGNKNPFQVLTFCLMDSGDSSIIIRTLEERTNRDSLKDCGIFYLDDKTEIRDMVFDDYDLVTSLEEEYDFYIEDLWVEMPSWKSYLQVYRGIECAIADFDLSLLNIKYPLEVYIDYEGADPCSGKLITKIDN